MKTEILLTNLRLHLYFTDWHLLYMRFVLAKKKKKKPTSSSLSLFPCASLESKNRWVMGVFRVKSHLSSANRGQTGLMAMETNKSKWSCKLSPPHSHQHPPADLFSSKITDSDTHRHTGQTLQNLTFRTKIQTSIWCWKLCRGQQQAQGFVSITNKQLCQKPENVWGKKNKQKKIMHKWIKEELKHTNHNEIKRARTENQRRRRCVAWRKTPFFFLLSTTLFQLSK